MGFRTPLTSAEGVDTGAGGPEGVRVYQRDGDPFDAGVIEFYSRYGSAFITAVPYATDQGDGNFTRAGSSLELRGIDAGAPAPRLRLDVLELPAGGYSGYAFLDHAPRGFEPVYGPAPLPVNSPAFLPYDASYAPTVTRSADGTVSVDGTVKINGAVGNGTVVVTLPEGCRPDPARGNPGFVLAGGNNRTWRGDLIAATGQLVVGAVLAGDWSAGFGAPLSLQGVTFRAGS